MPELFAGNVWRKVNRTASRDLRSVTDDPAQRVGELVARYGDAAAGAGWLLCDRHDPGAIAFKVIAPDLSAADLTYGQLREHSERLAAALFALGIRNGDRVATLMGKSAEYLVTLMAIWRLGAVHVPPPAGLRLRCLSSAGEPLTPDINQWSMQALGLPVHDQFGQTEVGMLINNHHHPALRRPLRAGSMGHAMPGWTAAILKQDSDAPAPAGEVGRVAMDLARSPLAVFRGYIDDPEKSSEKFSADRRWYITGDVGCIDPDGYFYFSARDDDVIIMAGYRIGPFDVESVILAHPAISECAVIAVPDAIRGETLVAVIVLRPGQVASAALTAALQELVRSRYATHAYPRQVHYAGSLPKTPSGKIQRFALRQQLSQPPGCCDARQDCA